jgi:hypothetical protein
LTSIRCGTSTCDGPHRPDSDQLLSDSLVENLSNREVHDDAVHTAEECVDPVGGVAGEVEGDEKMKRMSRAGISRSGTPVPN